jgi:ABC-type nitrate/sulfonate/bicarbonate transport system permease component
VRPLARRVLGYVGAIVVIVVGWQVASSLLASPALPGPTAAIGMFFSHAGAIAPQFAVSALRVVSAILLGLVTGAPLGLLLGRSGSADSVFGPLVFLSYPVPWVVIMPVLIVLLGIGTPSIVTLIWIIVFFQILVTARDGARAIPSAAVLSVRSLGASRTQVLAHVVVPGAMPAIFTALRISSGTAVAVLFFTESIAGSTGLGYYVFDAWGRVQYSDMFAGILAMALLGVLLYEVIDVVQSRVCRWERAGR